MRSDEGVLLGASLPKADIIPAVHFEWILSGRSSPAVGIHPLSSFLDGEVEMPLTYAAKIGVGSYRLSVVDVSA